MHRDKKENEKDRRAPIRPSCRMFKEKKRECNRTGGVSRKAGHAGRSPLDESGGGGAGGGGGAPSNLRKPKTGRKKGVFELQRGLVDKREKNYSPGGYCPHTSKEVGRRHWSRCLKWKGRGEGGSFSCWLRNFKRKTKEAVPKRTTERHLDSKGKPSYETNRKISIMGGGGKGGCPTMS